MKGKCEGERARMMYRKGFPRSQRLPVNRGEVSHWYEEASVLGQSSHHRFLKRHSLNSTPGALVPHSLLEAKQRKKEKTTTKKMARASKWTESEIAASQKVERTHIQKK